MHGSRYLRLALLGATLFSTPLLAATPNANQTNNPPAAGTTDNATATTPAPGANTTNNAAATTPAPAHNMATTMTPANNHNAGAANVPVTNTAANNNNKGPDGTLHKYDNAWRASKLVGADVYNEQGQTVASIDDLLVSDDGKIDRAVLSTGGGILGVGAKLVTVPFDQLKFEPSVNNTNHVVAANGNTNAQPNAAVLPRTEAPAGNGNPNGNAATTANAQTAPTTVVANNNNNAANNSNPENFSIVLPGATKDSLKNAQEFKYAAD